MGLLIVTENELNPYPVQTLPDLELRKCIHDFNISEEDVSSAMHNIPDKLYRSPNGIPAYFWKRASAPFFHVIAFLFDLSLSQGVKPFQWKTAIVVAYPCLRNAIVIYLATTGLYL